MPEKPPPSAPILSYGTSLPRRPNLWLANLVAIAGILSWFVGVPILAIGIISLASAMGDGESNIMPVVLIFVGFGSCALALWLCGTVHGIAEGK